ncbi:hypothetical protein ACX2QB_00670 [Weissella viridescens]
MDHSRADILTSFARRDSGFLPKMGWSHSDWMMIVGVSLLGFVTLMLLTRLAYNVMRHGDK